MMEELLELCLYYKKETINPFNPVGSYMEQLRYHFWESERRICEHYDMALEDFNMYNKSNNVDPGKFTPEDVFKHWLKFSILKHKDEKYDSIATYFQNKLILR